MKKLIVVTLMLSIAGMAFASSLAIPWFVDQASKVATRVPPQEPAALGFIYLKNNTASELPCTIEYFTQSGQSVGPPAPGNSFVIQPKASIAFRPCASDPDSITGGQEAVTAGWLVPDRPPWGNSSAYPAEDPPKINGSAVITWLGGETAVQGMLLAIQSSMQPDSTSLKIVSYAHLLPPGA